MTTPDTPRNDAQQDDPLDDTTFETAADHTTTDDTITTDHTTTDDTTNDTKQLEQTVHSDTSHQSEPTERLDTTEATRAIGVEEPASRDLFGNPVHHADAPVSASSASSASSAAVADEHVIAPLPERPRGPHAPAIVLGLVCLAVAGIILAQELGSLTVDWGNIGPLGIVLTGAVLVLFGLVGLFTSRRDKTS